MSNELTCKTIDSSNDEGKLPDSSTEVERQKTTKNLVTHVMLET